jgi:hypothetical protein
MTAVTLSRPATRPGGGGAGEVFVVTNMCGLLFSCRVPLVNRPVSGLLFGNHIVDASSVCCVV